MAEIQLWAFQQRKKSCSTVRWLERAHRRTARAIGDPENVVLGWGDCTRMGGKWLGMQSLQKARGQAVTALPEISQKPAAKRKQLFSVPSEDKARYQGVKLQQGRWGLSLGKAFKQ